MSGPGSWDHSQMSAKKRRKPTSCLCNSHSSLINLRHRLTGDKLSNSLWHAPRYCKVLCKWNFYRSKLSHKYIKTLMRLGCYAMKVSAFVKCLMIRFKHMQECRVNIGYFQKSSRFPLRISKCMEALDRQHCKTVILEGFQLQIVALLW